MAICSGTTKSGAPCKAHAAKGDAYCHRHIPAEKAPESPRAVVDEPEVSTETEGAAASSPELIADELYATPIADPRPFPPSNARTTEPGKAHPYAEIKKLLKAHQFHKPRNAYGIRGSAQDKVYIPQEKGGLATRGGWLGAVIKKNEMGSVYIPCCAVGCKEKADVGAHVWFTTDGVADLTTAYIVPTCKGHNAKTFDYGTYTPFTVKPNTHCISMPPHVMYAEYKKHPEM